MLGPYLYDVPTQPINPIQPLPQPRVYSTPCPGCGRCHVCGRRDPEPWTIPWNRIQPAWGGVSDASSSRS